MYLSNCLQTAASMSSKNASAAAAAAPSSKRPRRDMDPAVAVADEQEGSAHEPQVPAIFTQLKLRIKSIMYSVRIAGAWFDTFSTYSRWPDFLQLTAETKQTLAFDLPADVAEILSKSLTADIALVERLLATWFDPSMDVLQIAHRSEHLHVMIVALTLTKQWATNHSQFKGTPMAANTIVSQIDELFFALLPHMAKSEAQFDGKRFLRMMAQIVPEIGVAITAKEGRNSDCGAASTLLARECTRSMRGSRGAPIFSSCCCCLALAFSLFFPSVSCVSFLHFGLGALLGFFYTSLVSSVFLPLGLPRSTAPFPPCSVSPFATNTQNAISFNIPPTAFENEYICLSASERDGASNKRKSMERGTHRREIWTVKPAWRHRTKHRRRRPSSLILPLLHVHSCAGC
jgi:hypothetical protein